MSELMERLARANPQTGKALTEEEQREADAVLERILADRTAVEAPRRGRLLGRVAPAGALLAVAALATVVAIDLIDSEEGEGRIIERAAAAVSQQDVIYAISVREVVTSVPVEPDADPPQREGSFGRYWIWGGGDRSRYLMYRLLPAGRRGRLESEIAVNGNLISWFHPDANVIDVMKRPSPDWPAGPDANGYPGFSPFSDPGAQLRARVEEGTLRVTGRTTVRGRTAYRLVSKARRDPQEGVLRESVTYLVDARTYLPLEIRSRSLGDFGRVDPALGGRQLVSWRAEYLRYERLPLTGGNRALLRMRPHPGAHVRGP